MRDGKRRGRRMSDLIKREDAIKALRLEYPMMPLFKAMREEWAFRTEGFRRAEEVIMRLPSAERKGEWKDRTYGGRILHPWWESCECSQCEEWGSGAWNFCPNCGARMKGAEDE
jgi:hypothetical protein